LCAHPPGLGLERGQLVLEDQVGLVEQPSNQGALAVVDAAARDDAQQVLLLLVLEIGDDVVGAERLRSRQK
jgi:hypothetical protein